MGRKARVQVDPNRKFITKRLLAEYLGLHRNSLNNRLLEYGKKVNLYDTFAVLNFILWIFGVTYSQDGGDDDDTNKKGKIN